MRKRIVAYHQLESSDCGLTCVRIIVRYRGKRVSDKRLREMASSRWSQSLNGSITAI